jgi:peptide chain release factor 1
MHIPTGRIVRCQDGRSQQKNKEAALKIMRSRLLEDKRREEEAKYSAHRKSLIGGGGREEKIRTYNFAENRITDHRLGQNFSLAGALEGDIDTIVQSCISQDQQEQLAALASSPDSALSLN